MISLNPFFIRSRFGTCRLQELSPRQCVSQSLLHQVQVWNYLDHFLAPFFFPEKSQSLLHQVQVWNYPINFIDVIETIESQSLLHQVQVWNSYSCPIPRGEQYQVSIPSSSGLGLERQHKQMHLVLIVEMGLNPFFIRSRFGTLGWQCLVYSMEKKVSIPSSSGLGLERWPASDSQISSYLRLNPFFIRSRFGTLQNWQMVLLQMKNCLNPFFIRSRFGTLPQMKQSF